MTLTGDWTTPFDVDFAATNGPNTRWSSGLLRPVDDPDRAAWPGLRSFVSAPTGATLRWVGEGTVACDLGVSVDAVAVHAYVEVVAADGRVRLLTEGVTRATGGPVTVRLRPVAVELPTGASLRLSFAGADADTFERVPATGPATWTFTEPCVLQLPLDES
jgi:predicted acyl esterase